MEEENQILSEELVTAKEDESDSEKSDTNTESEIIMLNPTKEYERPFLYAFIPSISRSYKYDISLSGKWMMFFAKNILDEKWKMCCDLYKARKLTGIAQMKVSTSVRSPRTTDHANGVIIFYCGPANDEEAVMAYGKKLLEVVPYTGNRYMYYKSDEQTYEGTRATGQKKNHLYKISVPVVPESWRK
ncbi:unnamed protein product [Phaedon cochleariae]|uniref:Uncharacterized protein n=1 Tax=Phaedon cochleariae TaxID=80249 RepID=A0A9P0DIU6_PHACE|nr:unnamed protein product [Phaedon cochleariae]